LTIGGYFYNDKNFMIKKILKVVVIVIKSMLAAGEMEPKAYLITSKNYRLSQSQ